MPMIKFKAIEAKDVCSISKNLIDELEELINRPRKHFSLSVDQSVYVKDGEVVKGEPVIEVLWVDRSQEIQDKAAKIITKYMNSVGYSNLDIIFSALDKSKYYKNGDLV
ncbi:DUF1904 family protein [Clostridium sp.]|uniref:DUF1904 family protein n=1 Tax=Clostridium sp. TaxID=1506 RepID=UPI002615E01E|nr:DUF1904 family protein [Clostridium sp.]